MEDLVTKCEYTVFHVSDTIADQGVSGAMTLPDQPHFLWVTQFPLFTRADEDKEFMSRGRWSSTHHPFTAPLFEDLEDLKKGEVDKVSFHESGQDEAHAL